MIMNRLFTFFLFLGISLSSITAQETEEVGGRKWGIKIGPTVGFQGTRGPLLRYHGSFFLESSGNENNALFAQVGYHARGFANRFTFQTTPNQPQSFKTYSIPTIFHNAAISFGIKKRGDYSDKLKYFYSFGMRGEFTFKTNLPYLDLTTPQNNQNNVFNNYYFSNYVRPLNWGMDIGGGFEKKISELILGFVEFTLSPDLSYQYRTSNVNSTGGFAGVGGHRNLSMELSVGCRFWQKVIYE